MFRENNTCKLTPDSTLYDLNWHPDEVILMLPDELAEQQSLHEDERPSPLYNDQAD